MLGVADDFRVASPLLFELGPAVPTPVPQFLMILRLDTSTKQPSPNVPFRLGFGRVGCELLGRNMPAERDIALPLVGYINVLADGVLEFEE